MCVYMYVCVCVDSDPICDCIKQNEELTKKKKKKTEEQEKGFTLNTQQRLSVWTLSVVN